MESGQNLGSGLVAVKLDVVTDPVGGKEAIDAAGLQEFVARNFIEQLLRLFVGERLVAIIRGITLEQVVETLIQLFDILLVLLKYWSEFLIFQFGQFHVFRDN